MSSHRVSTDGDNDINTEVIIIPQNIKILRCKLSAKNPNIGCSIDAQICDNDNTIVAIAIVMPNFTAINGIIGFSIPVYISFVKCAVLSQNCVFFSLKFSINKF